MSRYEETQETLEKLGKSLVKLFYDEELETEEIYAAQISGMIDVLSEIALSLAVIADRGEV